MADSSKDIQLRELKDMINDLRKMIKTLQATVDAVVLCQEKVQIKNDFFHLASTLPGKLLLQL